MVPLRPGRYKGSQICVQVPPVAYFERFSVKMTQSVFRVLTLAALLVVPVTQAATIIPKSAFNSVADFEKYFDYLYPWGSDHNGSGRMVKGNVNVASGTLGLVATPTSNPSPPTSAANPHPAIHYASGAVHAKEHITVDASNSYSVYGEFSAPTTRGTWPAFWLTAVNGWPPEVDIGEWKGTTDNWYNTFNTSSQVKSNLVSWPSDLSFHSLRADLTAQGSSVKIDFYMDGQHKATQWGANFAGAPMWLIINLQMEGSSGSPGPTGTTTYKIRNVEVTKN